MWDEKNKIKTKGQRRDWVKLTPGMISFKGYWVFPLAEGVYFIYCKRNRLGVVIKSGSL